MDGSGETDNYYKARKVADLLPVQEKKIALKWIDKIESYHSTTDPDLSKTRDELMKNLLSVLRSELYLQIMMSNKAQGMTPTEKTKLKEEVERVGVEGAEFPLMESVYKQNIGGSHNFMGIWSKDKRTYIAIRPIGGEGALVFMAVTSNPRAGWDLPDPTSGFYRYPTNSC